MELMMELLKLRERSLCDQNEGGLSKQGPQAALPGPRAPLPRERAREGGAPHLFEALGAAGEPREQGAQEEGRPLGTGAASHTEILYTGYIICMLYI